MSTNTTTPATTPAPAMWAIGPAMLGVCRQCASWDVQVHEVGHRLAGTGFWFYADLCVNCLDSARGMEA
jgi:hypothetical protein